jgi:proteic killer suppression protein
MEVYFRDQKLETLCRDHRQLQRRYGEQRAKLLVQRVAELLAFEILAQMRNYPLARCHELVGERKGQLSVDLDWPYRLIFEVINNPIPKKRDGGLNWNKVTKIMIIEIADTHE